MLLFSLLFGTRAFIRIATIEFVKMSDQRWGIVWIASKPAYVSAPSHKSCTNQRSKSNAPKLACTCRSHLNNFNFSSNQTSSTSATSFAIILSVFVRLLCVAIHSIISACFCVSFPVCLPQLVAVARRRRRLPAKPPTPMPILSDAQWELILFVFYIIIDIKLVRASMPIHTSILIYLPHIVNMLVERKL